MGLKIATTSLHWSQPSVPHSPSSSQTLASAVSSPNSKRRSSISSDGALFCRFSESKALFGAHKSSKIYRSRSCNNLRSPTTTLRRAFSASLNSFSDEEFSKNIQELADRFRSEEDNTSTHKEIASDFVDTNFLENMKMLDAITPPDFPERDEIIPANIERKANSVDIPMSLRMIKRKKQWKEGFVLAGESACCSVKKAFSSMVFIIRELHSYTLHMREELFFEDLQGILARVQTEMNASFVWLFQQVFSHTPTLMVYVMILLANYSVYSMSNNLAIAANQPVQVCEATVVEGTSRVSQKFDSSAVKTLKLSSLNGNTASVGGNNGGGGGNMVASNTDGDGKFEESSILSIGNPLRTSGEESVSRQEEKEANLWDSIVEEASKMQKIDQETMLRFVSPVDAKIEDDDYVDHFKTELLYQTGLAQDPSNPLLLANYAQFLYLVAQEFDSAEIYFKKATSIEPKDAEALNKYANFLWAVRKDLWAAEETYLEAIDLEPDNSFYTANYAHFLWNTGAEDTCFPLNSPDSSIDV